MKTFLIACIPSIITGIGSLIVAVSQMKTIKEQSSQDNRQFNLNQFYANRYDLI